jgi:hypothetical protein
MKTLIKNTLTAATLLIIVSACGPKAMTQMTDLSSANNAANSTDPNKKIDPIDNGSEPTPTPPPVVNYPQVTCDKNPPPEIVGTGLQVIQNQDYPTMGQHYRDHGLYNTLADLLSEMRSRGEGCGIRVYTTFGSYGYTVALCPSPMPPPIEINTLQTSFCCNGGFWSNNCGIQ